LANIVWPTSRHVSPNTRLPDEVTKAQKNDPDSVAIFKDMSGKIAMIQLRVDKDDGTKYYLPYSFWSDDQWWQLEPEGKLPLWGIEQLESYTNVFIHEGVKAARKMRRFVDGKTKHDRDELAAHPWRDRISRVAHLGWVGGAPNPNRTDWAIINRNGVERAYIVSDNDEPGLSAVPKISKQLCVPTFHVQFTDEWPKKFDLGDDFPVEMFKDNCGKKIYVGPDFEACVHPATWATVLVYPENGKGKPHIKLRKSFSGMWHFIEELDFFICSEMPEILLNESTLNKVLRPFSDSTNTSRYILADFTGRQVSLAYRPDTKERIITESGKTVINRFIPPTIKPVEGEPTPFLEFMQYLVPDEKDRQEVLRWVATLIARPEVKMKYAMLLVSETQGIGKTTLGESILAPLVGKSNVSFPTESAFASEFNSWAGEKRLAIVNEIYQGHSWKMYNTIKSVLTDKNITINEKYAKPYTIENWLHVFATSNSYKALKVDEGDRRWLIPRVAEKKWKQAKFTEFYQWLEAGGMSIILHWAKGYGKYIGHGDTAPATAMKTEMIEESFSEAAKFTFDFGEDKCEMDTPYAISLTDFKTRVKNETEDRVYESTTDLRKHLVSKGMKTWPQRVSINGRKDYVITNPLAWDKAKKLPNDEANALLRKLCGARDPF